MDGRSVHQLKIKKSGRPAMALMIAGGMMLAAMLTLPHAAQAQAMGKVSLDNGPVAPEGIAPAPAAAPVTNDPAEAPVDSVTPKTEAPEAPASRGDTNEAGAPALQKIEITGLSAPLMLTPAGDLNPMGPITAAAEPKPSMAPSAPIAASVVKPVATREAPVEVGKAAVVSKAPTIEDEPIRGRTTDAASASTKEHGVSPAAAQERTGGNSGTVPSSSGWYSQFKGLAQLLGAMAVVIGLILILKGLAKKFVPGAKAAGGKGVIEVLARHPIAKNQAIVLVRIGSQIVALNQGKESSESVLVISEATEVAKIIGQIEGKKAHSSQAGFTKLLANARVDLEQGEDAEPELAAMSPENLDEQLEEMAAAKRQLMELRQHVRTVRDRLPKS